MKKFKFVLPTIILIACSSPKNEIFLDGNWILNTESRKVEGVKINIPVNIVQKDFKCKAYIEFLSNTLLEIGDCIPDFKNINRDSVLVQSTSKFSYLLKDSIIEFNNRKLKISFISKYKLTIHEMLLNDTIEFNYSRLLTK